MITESVVDELRAIFMKFDGGKGCLSREDLKCAIIAFFGFSPSKKELDSNWLGGKDTIDMSEYLNKMLAKWDETTQSKNTSEVSAFSIFREPRQSEAFPNYEQIKQSVIYQQMRAFDTEGKGFITVHDMRALFEKLRAVV
eukprot:TRINITY_DN3054_c0_g1_i2.p1 TRINITY_DN3054_c0_g1~~TRINITY_DN3054_c0_g1_i2.p1  ORF type:complete len:140 (-),score=24.79 TRINITY_DN3054_c0_g1_i2:299-718(-)